MAEQPGIGFTGPPGPGYTGASTTSGAVSLPDVRSDPHRGSVGYQPSTVASSATDAGVERRPSAGTGTTSVKCESCGLRRPKGDALSPESLPYTATAGHDVWFRLRPDSALRRRRIARGELGSLRVRADAPAPPTRATFTGFVFDDGCTRPHRRPSRWCRTACSGCPRRRRRAGWHSGRAARGSHPRLVDGSCAHSADSSVARSVPGCRCRSVPRRTGTAFDVGEQASAQGQDHRLQVGGRIRAALASPADP